MTEDLIGEPPYYAVTAGSSVKTYHADEGCNRINAPEKVADRSARFVRWHDLDPCAWCHDELEDPSNAGAEISTLAKSLGGGGDD